MRNDGRALTESFFIHGLLAGALVFMIGTMPTPPKTIRIDFSLLEQMVASPKEQSLPEPPQVQKQPLPPQPAPAPKPKPQIKAKVPPKISKPLPVHTPPEVTTPAPAPDSLVQQTEESLPKEPQQPVAAGPTSPQVSSSSVDTTQLAQYLGLIRSRIERQKRYPLWARSHRMEGEVSVRFVIAPDGQISAVTVSKSSGRESLDQAALEAVQEASPLPRPPNGIVTRPTAMELTIVFKLT
jgi:periplasmic protein TonB